jgi:hypothetical protein
MTQPNDIKTTPKVGALTTEIGECFFMFSYFKGGIKSLVPDKSIDLPTLVTHIRFNPLVDNIQEIRTLRIEGEEKLYVKKKKECHYITPNCIVRHRRLKGKYFNYNFIQSSSYIYLDIDLSDISKVEEYKKYFIERYGHLVSLVCVSISGGGISILVKISEPITDMKRFYAIRSWIKNNVFKDEDICTGSSGFGRAMYISYDPDVYVNYENELTLPPIECLEDIPVFEEDNSKDFLSFNGDEISYFTPIPIKQVFEKLILSTRVEVVSPVIDFNPVPFVEVSYPGKIKDGTKHKIYTLLIHRLVHLNPHLPPNYIFSFINYLNDTVAEEPKMSYRELKFVFSTNYQITQSEEYLFKNNKIKQFHFNPLFKGNKSKIINEINGKIKTNKTIEKIQDAKDIIREQGKKPTQKEIARLIGMSKKTVQTHYHSMKVDLDELIRKINEDHRLDSSNIPSNSHQVFKNRPWGGLGKNNEQEPFIHPECPKWVLQWEKEKDRI